MYLVGHKSPGPYDWNELLGRIEHARELVRENRIEEAEFLIRGVRKIIERFEHRSARWGVMTLELAWFRFKTGDWQGCLPLARDAASSLLNSGRASGGLPYTEACLLVGRCYVEAGEHARAVSYLEVASSATQAWGEHGSWISEAADVDLGCALGSLQRWGAARAPLERAWEVVMRGSYSRTVRRTVGAMHAIAQSHAGQPEAAWRTIRACILDLRDETTWNLAFEIIAQIGEARGDERAVALWRELEWDCEDETRSDGRPVILPFPTTQDPPAGASPGRQSSGHFISSG